MKKRGGRCGGGGGGARVVCCVARCAKRRCAFSPRVAFACRVCFWRASDLVTDLWRTPSPRPPRPPRPALPLSPRRAPNAHRVAPPSRQQRNGVGRVAPLPRPEDASADAQRPTVPGALLPLTAPSAPPAPARGCVADDCVGSFRSRVNRRAMSAHARAMRVAHRSPSAISRRPLTSSRRATALAACSAAD